MQTILGAGGIIGIEVAKTLLGHTDEIRLVSRSPRKVNDSDQLMVCDLLDGNQVDKAVKGSEVVYLLVGLKYDLKVWRQSWPKIMEHTLDACEKYGSKLVFFDNIYMYDCNSLSDMTEHSTINPCSEKGKVRMQIAEMLMDRVEKGKLQALIARSADFYGPDNSTSVLIETVYNPLKQGKTANLMGPDQFVHSYTYTPDAGETTALLGNTPEAYDQVWHLPTCSDKITGRDWVELFADHLEVAPKYRVAGKWMIKIMGVFVPVMKEMVEMMYQYDRDYYFNSSKFESFFDFNTTSYEEGVATIVTRDRNDKSA